jgi:hypothetical protein
VGVFRAYSIRNILCPMALPYLTRLRLKEWPWREIRQGAITLLLPGLIIWLGGDAIGHISRLYDGLCAEQEPGMAHYPFDDIRQGYCTGIDSYLSVLGVIMLLAALASAVALTLWQKHMDNA